MPKNKEIGGCAGTQYGCCPDGVTAKKDADGSNCSHSKVKTLYTFQLTGDYLEIKGKFKNAIKHLNTDLGFLNLNLENHHNYSIFSFKYTPSKLAKNNGMIEKTYTTTVKFSKLPKKSKQEVRDFLNNLPNYNLVNNSLKIKQIFNSVNTQFTFYTNVLKSLTYRTTFNLFLNSFKNLYFNFNLISPNYSTTSSSNSTTNSSWSPGAIAGVTIGAITAVFVATLGALAYYYDLYLAPKAWWDQSRLLKSLEAGAGEAEAEAVERESEITEYKQDSAYATKFPNPPVLDEDNEIELEEDKFFHEVSPHKGPDLINPALDPLLL
jgi:hypothetical protein